MKEEFDINNELQKEVEKSKFINEVYKPYFYAKAKYCRTYEDVMELFVIDVTCNLMRVGCIEDAPIGNFLNEVQSVNPLLKDLPTIIELEKKFWQIHDEVFPVIQKVFKRD